MLCPKLDRNTIETKLDVPQQSKMGKMCLAQYLNLNVFMSVEKNKFLVIISHRVMKNSIPSFTRLILSVGL